MNRRAPFPSTDVILRNLLTGLTVSFVAISLGAAFGLLSGRGAFAGIVSAGIIAVITAAFGGTRVQCSGPTAPMTAVMAIAVAFAATGLAARFPEADPDHFLNIVLVLTGILLVLGGMLRLGRFIALVPTLVVSGFMDGIAILIWVDQLQRLMGWGGREAFGGARAANVAIAAATTLLVFAGPRILKRLAPAIAAHVPMTLVTIVLVTALVGIAGVGVGRIELATSLRSLADVRDVMVAQWPTAWSVALVVAAVPFAVQLALLGYLDTLLTSRIVDQLTGEPTAQDRELRAQGFANAAVAAFGGIPGAQATIRSVLMIKEGATMRLAGIATGVFVLIEMLVFQDWLNYIPQAVFTGVLVKVGYDVFDWTPARRFLSRFRVGSQAAPEARAPVPVSSAQMAFVAGTAAVTVAWNLNAAVIGFSLLFCGLHRWAGLRDLVLEEPIADEA